jgi:hypothetical protein
MKTKTQRSSKTSAYSSKTIWSHNPESTFIDAAVRLDSIISDRLIFYTENELYYHVLATCHATMQVFFHLHKWTNPRREVTVGTTKTCTVVPVICGSSAWNLFNPFGAGIFFKILAHPVFKMWILQEPKKIALLNKRHLEEKKTENIQHV